MVHPSVNAVNLLSHFGLRHLRGVVARIGQKSCSLGQISALFVQQRLIEGTLDRYAGSTQVHLIGDERWGSYLRSQIEEVERAARRMIDELSAELLDSYWDFLES